MAIYGNFNPTALPVTYQKLLALRSGDQNLQGKALAELLEAEARPKLEQLLENLGIKNTQGSLEDLAQRAYKHLQTLTLKSTEKDLMIDLLELPQLLTQVREETRTSKELAFAAATNVLDQIILLTDHFSPANSAQIDLSKTEIPEDIADEVSDEEDKPKAKNTLELKVKLDSNTSADHHSGSNDSPYYRYNSPSTRSWGSNSYRDRKDDRPLVKLITIDDAPKAKPDNAKLAETLKLISESFPEILASADIDQIFSALAHAYHNCHAGDHDHLEIKASFNKNKELKADHYNAFIQELKKSPELRSEARAYTLQHYGTISQSSFSNESFNSWLRDVFHVLNADSIISHIFCLEDLKKFSSAELKKAYQFLIDSQYIFSYQEKQVFLINLVEVLEKKLEQNTDDTELKELKDKTIDELVYGVFRRDFPSRERSISTKIFCKYNPEQYRKDLLERITQGYELNDYFFKAGKEEPSLADCIKAENPAPEIFKVTANSTSFTDDFAKEILQVLKENISQKSLKFDSHNDHSYQLEIKMKTLIETINFLNKMGVETRGLFNDDELLEIVSSKGKIPIFDTRDPKYQDLIQHSYLIMGHRPFPEASILQLSSKLFELLTLSGVPPVKATINDEFIQSLISSNLEYALKRLQGTWGGDGDYRYLIELFESYIPNDEKRKFLEQNYQCRDLVEQIEKYLNLSLDDFYKPIAGIDQEMKETILKRLNPKAVVKALNERISSYLNGDNYSLNGFYRESILKKSVLEESKYLANLCQTISNKYALVDDLRRFLFNSEKSFSKSKLESIFKKYLKDSDLANEFFANWEHLDEKTLRLAATRIIREENRQEEIISPIGQKIITDKDDVKNLKAAMFNSAASFSPASFMAELFQNKSLPWLFIRIFDSCFFSSNPTRLENHFAEQSETWYRAYSFSEKLSNTKGSSDFLRLLASRANMGQMGSSPAFLTGSGLHNSHRLYTPGDDVRYIDWGLWARTDKLYTKTYLDDIHLKQKEYIIDLESLLSEVDKDHRLIGKSNKAKIETLLIELCRNFQKGNNQNLQIRYKSALIFKLDKRRLAHMFQQSASSQIQDQYSRRSGLMDFYLTLDLLTSLVEFYSKPFDEILSPVISGTDWQPKPKSQIIFSAANKQSILHPASLEQIRRWSSQGSEILELCLAPKVKAQSSRAGAVAG